MKKPQRFFRLPLGLPGQLRREVDEELPSNCHSLIRSPISM